MEPLIKKLVPFLGPVLFFLGEDKFLIKQFNGLAQQFSHLGTGETCALDDHGAQPAFLETDWHGCAGLLNPAVHGRGGLGVDVKGFDGKQIHLPHAGRISGHNDASAYIADADGSGKAFVQFFYNFIHDFVVNHGNPPYRLQG